MIKKIYLGVTVAALTAAIAGCSTLSTTVIPEAQNKYSVVATAEDSATVMNGAVKKANEVCTKQGKKLVVLSHKTKYQGAGKELGTVTSMASQAAFMIGNVAGVPTSKTATDYKTTLEFECQ